MTEEATGLPDFPPAAVTPLMRALGAYLRAVPAHELPGSIRRFRGFRQTSLTAHRLRLLRALEDPGLRARLAHWLDEERPRLDPLELEVIRLVASRPEGWLASLAALTPPPSTDEGDAASRAGAADQYRDASPELVERERRRADKARAEARRAREEARELVEGHAARADALAEEVDRLRTALAAAQTSAQDARREAERAAQTHERELRRARRAAELAGQERDRALSAAKEARKESASQARRAAEAERKLGALSGRQAAAGDRRHQNASASAGGPRVRRPLPVPRGLLPDDPKTLTHWLQTPKVRLLVDGYNVARAEEGFSALELDGQRRRTLDEVARLSRRHGVVATVVFDGSDVGPGTFRKRRGGVEVEYSKPPETADDHLVGLLAALPQDPVIVVTNDRELQERAVELGATIATSDQLLASVR